MTFEKFFRFLWWPPSVLEKNEDGPYQSPVPVYLWHYQTLDRLEAVEVKTHCAALVYHRMCSSPAWNTEDDKPPYRGLPVKSRKYVLDRVTDPKTEDAGGYMRIVRHCYLHEEVEA